MNRKTFRQACCEKLGIPSEAFEKTVLWRCFYRRGALPGRLLWLFKPSAFQDDLDLIRAVGVCTRLSEVSSELASQRFHRPNVGFRRRTLRVRMSGQRLMDFAAQFLEEDKPALTTVPSDG